MKFNYQPLLVVALGLVSGCQQKQVYDDDVRLMAALQCEARHLKEERFSIANDFRFRSDSLMKINVALTDAQKREEDSIRKLLAIRTGEVAVRLTRSMDSLFDIHYQDVAQREAFDAAVAKKMEEVCPEK